MITRAIVEDVDLQAGKLQVRIPILDGMQFNSERLSNVELNWAAVLCTPGLEIDYKVGDIVVVGFEDNDIGSPIVLGYLKLANTTLEPRLYGTFKQLEATESFQAPTNTIIGKTPYSEINRVVTDKDLSE